MTDALWTQEKLVSAIHGRPLGDMPPVITGISIDSRSVAPGDAFFAIKGDNFDGHKFVGAAERAGAVVAIVAERKLASLGAVNLPLIVVHDVLEAMVLLGRASRARAKGKIIAITGSVGKTTTKEMMRTVLAASGSVHASVASFNNHWGVPLTLARMPENVQFAIFEIGMNHPNEITPLVDMVRPHVALITNVAEAHLGSFKNVGEIAKAKAEIFSGLVEGGTAILNHDNEHYKTLKRLAKKAGIEKVLSFGANKDANFRARSTARMSDRSEVEADILGETLSFCLNVSGQHMVSNALGVMGVALVVGANMPKSAVAIETVTAVQGRGERHSFELPEGTLTIIDEAYNANSSSMEAAFSVLGESKPGKGGRRIAVLGDMLELGVFSEGLHKKLADPIVANDIDLVFLVGSEMLALKEALPPERIGGHFNSVDGLETQLLKKLHGGDIVIFKASLGMKFIPVVKNMVVAFNKKST
ncbi:MAG: UDP-N-acetylmuramoylalanyl-D-glutamyl-2,6-diaminopimelate--D-alanyl-D-alanine ligase [Rhizobiaceae bacterium]|nr:UDP-N-acetylmuramoylalanyl-D-glutamyl-2,6-diaminopimelate--D-alanyl-D-alanine ligase [Rhizobiaceae bacterium]